MNPLSEILRDEVRRCGPISFHRFMNAALYHPEFGYYRRGRDPFGKAGDFYTAEQVQPVFGKLIAARLRTLFEEMGAPDDFGVVELGAGRAEMAPALSEWPYTPIDLAGGRLPERVRGVIFLNEFFDALPVHVTTFSQGVLREIRVGCERDLFVWVMGVRASDEMEAYVQEFFPVPRESAKYEVNLDALRWVERIARSLEWGYVFTIDYGYSRSESVRFLPGTLMSYHRHIALEDVLVNPGERDITAHVNFTALEEHGSHCGLERVRFETLGQTLLAAGEADAFADILRASSPAEEFRHRLQLKTLLFGLGETFRTLLQKKESTK